MSGEFDREGRSFPHFALDFDPPSVGLHDAVRGAETQSRALSNILCGKEGIEDTSEVLFRNALTRIRKLHEDQFPISRRGGDNGEAWLLRH